MKFRCPICKKAVKLGDTDFPFCSERCRTRDLAAWSNEEYRVSSSAAPSEDEEEPRDAD